PPRAPPTSPAPKSASAPTRKWCCPVARSQVLSSRPVSVRPDHRPREQPGVDRSHVRDVHVARQRAPRAASRRPPVEPSRALVDVQSELDFAHPRRQRDRKSTRLNSSHVQISYAAFCLKKKRQLR